VDSRFDDQVYLTSLLQSHSVITVHTFHSFWITNPSMLCASCALIHCQVSSSSAFCRILIWSELTAESEFYVTTDGQPASLSWNKAPIRGLRPNFYYCQTVAGLFMLGALSDERTGLSFTIAAGPTQRSHSRVRVPWDLLLYFTLSYLRLPFLSPPTTRGVTVKVFDPASTRV
jgi:hypothetical protein